MTGGRPLARGFNISFKKIPNVDRSLPDTGGCSGATPGGAFRIITEPGAAGSSLLDTVTAPGRLPVVDPVLLQYREPPVARSLTPVAAPVQLPVVLAVLLLHSAY